MSDRVYCNCTVLVRTRTALRIGLRLATGATRITRSKPALFIILSTPNLTRTGWGQTRASAVRGERLHYTSGAYTVSLARYHDSARSMTSFVVNALCMIKTACAYLLARILSCYLREMNAQ